MGGKVVVFVGDFRQTTLVPPRFGGRSFIIDNSVRRSPVWAKVTKYTLLQNMRAIQDTNEFREWLPHVGNGMPTTLSTGVTVLSPTAVIPACMLVPDVPSLQRFVFGNYSD